MIPDDKTQEPDWESPLQLTLTPNMLINTLMGTASAVHTGWQSCIEESLVVSNLIAVDDRTGDYVRLAEMEFVEDEDPDVVWHDWTLELRFGRVLTTGHWQVQTSSPLLQWDWSAGEAGQAFEKACAMIGRRVRRGLVVDETQASTPPPQSTRH